MKIVPKIIPEWKSLNKETLKQYRFFGLLIMFVGIAILVAYTPTIKIWFKLLGGSLAGYGFVTFLTAIQFLKK